MKKIYFSIVFVLCFSASFGQKVIDYAIRVSAVVQKSPAQITLVWPKDVNVGNCYIYKKLKTDGLFPKKALATLTATDTSYVDKAVTVGVNYEYELVKTIKSNTYYGYGYISSGIEVPLAEARGKLILLYDKTFLPTLQTEIDRLLLDMTNDGWSVISHGVNTTDKVTDIHALIEGDYNADKNNVKAVFLLGHIPVPYSGGDTSLKSLYGARLNPIDQHIPQHEGAWPADAYYGDMNGTWTDNTIIDTLGEFIQNHNVPEDGKFDQDVMPADLVLQVGRVDMYDLPAFKPYTEQDLIKRYLDKDHAWRMGKIQMQERGFISDNFGTLGGEAFGASAYKNFAPMFGAKNITDTGKWETTLSKYSYLWSYGCGPGSFTVCSGISTTNDFAKDSLQTVFTTLFGSYFGDWNETDNYLRAPLASKGLILTNCWNGRPQYQFHHMAMGDNIGYSMLINCNQYTNGFADYTNYFRSEFMGSADRVAIVALMGDPTLRMHTVQPPSAVTLSHVKLVMTVNWTASPDPGVVGYYVYRSSGFGQPFTKVSTNLVSGTTFTDPNALHGKNFYMVRAVKLQTSASGSYFNLSQGSMDTLSTDNLGTGIDNSLAAAHTLNVFPNPGQNIFHIAWAGTDENMGELKVYDVLGKVLQKKQLTGLVNLQTIDVDLSQQSKGIYFLKISNGLQEYVQRVVKE